MKKQKRWMIILMALPLILTYSNCSKPASVVKNKEEVFIVEPPPPTEEEIEVEPTLSAPIPVQSEFHLGNREYIVSVLKEIFTFSGGEAVIDEILSREIRGNIGAFGGACNVYSGRGLADCSLQVKAQQDTNDTLMPFAQPSSAIREARRVRACERIVDRQEALAAAVAKIPASSVNAKANETQIAQAFELFYPGQEITNDVRITLSNLVAAEGNPQGSWQLLFYALCVSPGWQSL